MTSSTHAALTLLPLSLLVFPEQQHSIVSAPPPAAQEVIELPEDDRRLDPNVLEEVFRIGGSLARGWDVLGYVPMVAFDERGFLHVLDAAEAVVYVVNAGGDLVRQLGRRGQGPGEFGSTRQLVVSRDGTVAILDATPESLSCFLVRRRFRGSISSRER